MAVRQQLQTRRFELKFIISEAKAQSIRAFVQNYLECDEYMRPDQPLGYAVRSLYLDSPDLSLCRQTVDGEKNRFKLRIRFYDDRDKSPAFLEIKRRENDVIRKQRAAITRSGVQRFLMGDFIDSSCLFRADTNSVSALDNFCHLTRKIGAVPSVFVVYSREAYVAPYSNDLRLTFDRQIESRLFEPGHGLHMSETRLPADVDGCVLEIKFTDRFPHWTQELVQTFNLRRTSMPKYVECVDATRRMGSLNVMMGRGMG